jgi:hypothetical protein
MPNHEERQVLIDDRKKGWFWDYNDDFDSPLSEHAIIVRLYLARCANKNHEAWPSLNTIARMCKISKPTVIKAVRELESQGWICRVVRKNNDEYDNTVYYLEDSPAGSDGDKTGSPGAEGGGKASLLPGKKEDGGAVKPVDHLVNTVDYPSKAGLPGVVKPVDSNNTNITIPIKGQQQTISDLSSTVDRVSDKNDVVVENAPKIFSAPDPDKKSHVMPREAQASERDLTRAREALPIFPEPTHAQLNDIVDAIKDATSKKFTLDAARPLFYTGQGDMERILKALKGAGVEYRRRKGGKDRVYNEMGWFMNAVVNGFVPVLENKYEDLYIT